MSVPRRRRSRIAQFKTPFIVSVAGPAALGIACGGQTGVDDSGLDTNDRSAVGSAGAGNVPPAKPPVDGGCKGDRPATSGCGESATCVDGKWVVSTFTCNPPALASCPSEMPEVGTSCALHETNTACEYPFCYGLAPLRSCNTSTGLWDAIPVPSCNPPPPSFACAATMPHAGSDCTLEGQLCEYPGCEGPTSSTATCRFGQWLVVYSIGAACNPPAVIPVCPERELIAGEGCAYEGQSCSRESCNSGAEKRTVHVCTSGIWQDTVLSCSPDAGAPDGG